MKASILEPMYVNAIPIELEKGKLYVSLMYGTAQHLCPCGCGNRIVTPLNKTGWTLRYDGKISLYPSIGNYEINCQSHYFITDNEVKWVTSESQRNFSTQKKKKKKKMRFKKNFPFIDLY